MSTGLPTGTLTGGCYCGAVRYSVAPGWRLPLYACHCTDCQRRSGASFQLALPIREKDLTVTGPLAEVHYVQPSGARISAFSCASCQTRLYVLNPNRPGLANIRAGTLDGAATLSPAVHIWVKSKQPWIQIPAGAYTVETEPRSPEEWLAIAAKVG